MGTKGKNEDTGFGSWHARRAHGSAATSRDGQEVGRTGSPQQSLLHPRAQGSRPLAAQQHKDSHESVTDSPLVSSPSADSLTGQRGFSLKQEDFLPAKTPVTQASSPSFAAVPPAFPLAADAGSSRRAQPVHNPADTALTRHGGGSPIPERSLGLPPSGARPVRRQQQQHSHPKKAQREHIPMTSTSIQSFGDQIRTANTLPAELNHSPATPDLSGNRTYTMTGTIKRGQKHRDTVEVQLHLTRDEVDRMQRSVTKAEEEKKQSCGCGLRMGPHILILTLLFLPFAFISSLAISFYVGTMCWYNLYLFLSEEKTIWHKIFLCPLLILFYPILIVLSSLGIALYAAFKQISWFLSSWLKEIRNFDKGFYGWLCNKLNVPECSPYEIVILNEGQHESITVPQAAGEENAQSAV